MSPSPFLWDSVIYNLMKYVIKQIIINKGYSKKEAPCARIEFLTVPATVYWYMYMLLIAFLKILYT